MQGSKKKVVVVTATICGRLGRLGGPGISFGYGPVNGREAIGRLTAVKKLRNGGSFWAPHHGIVRKSHGGHGCTRIMEHCLPWLLSLTVGKVSHEATSL